MITRMECFECGYKWECAPATEHRFKECPKCEGIIFNTYYVHDLRTEEEKNGGIKNV